MFVSMSKVILSIGPDASECLYGVMLRLLSLCLIVLMTSGCTRSSGYRQSPELTLEKLNPQVSLGHVEIDDQGELISFDQLKRVTAKIRAESSEPILLVVYIHGWNYNASDKWVTGNGNITDFRKLLMEMSDASGKKTAH